MTPGGVAALNYAKWPALAVGFRFLSSADERGRERERERETRDDRNRSEIKAARVFRLIDRSVDDDRPNCLSVQPVRRSFLGEMDFSVCAFEPREMERMMEDVQRACTRRIGMDP